jgi:hypothetical protein
LLPGKDLFFSQGATEMIIKRPLCGLIPGHDKKLLSP